MDYRELIKLHEGFKEYVYLDTEGKPTVGWGHCFHEEPRPNPGRIYSMKECEDFFDEDMQSVERDYVYLEEQYDLEQVGPVRRAVLKNMLFNLGLWAPHGKIRGFKRMWRAIAEKDWGEAAREMLDSKWARQVKSRAGTLARMMETNEWPII